MDPVIAQAELLHYYVKNGDLLAVQTLVGQGVDVNAQAGSGSGILCEAIATGRQESGAVMQALIDAGADLNATGADGRVPLVRAVLRDDVDACRRLLAAGVGQVRGGRSDELEAGPLSPFQLALRLGRLEMAWLLFEHFEEDLDQRTSEGSTMESLAAESGRLDGSELIRAMRTARSLRVEVGGGGPPGQRQRAKMGPSVL